ncbi:MAG TPA: hypothetical protein VMF88_02005 [Bacteroidota bacterium]|nr:hypothetical protein [Bacteroidota bacterium]
MRTSKKTVDRSSSAGVFKQCTMCGKKWSTKDAFLDDSEIRLNGYQWNKKRLRAGENLAGLLIFTHAKEECFTTLGIEARKFKVSSRTDE